MSNVAANVRKDKDKHPENYCPEPRCLWRTGGGYCPRHGGSITTSTGIKIRSSH